MTVPPPPSSLPRTVCATSAPPPASSSKSATTSGTYDVTVSYQGIALPPAKHHAENGQGDVRAFLDRAVVEVIKAEARRRSAALEAKTPAGARDEEARWRRSWLGDATADDLRVLDHPRW